MSIIIPVDETSSTWLDLLRVILTDGHEIVCRGRECIELISYHTIWNMRDPVIKLKERKLGYKFMQAEAMSIMNGDFRVSTLSPYSKIIASFSDDGKIFFGAYGPEIVSQLSHIYRTLIADPFSRQAILTIWKKSPPSTKDVPCTVSMQFMIRRNHLNTIVYMRSSDAWMGIPYDIFNFSMVTWGILLSLRELKPLIFDDVQLGKLYITVGSEHLYDSNINSAAVLTSHDDSINEYIENPVNLQSIFACKSYDDVIFTLKKGLNKCETPA